MKTLITRTITGLLFVAVMLGSLLYHSFAFAGVLVVIVALALWEFYSISHSESHKPQKVYGVICGTILYAASYLAHMGVIDPRFLVAAIPLIILMFILELYRKAALPLMNIALTILGLLYVVVPFILLTLAANIEVNGKMEYLPKLILGYLVILWMFDTGAYLTGSWLGRTKFFERVSPKKTWEGIIGGAVIGFLFAWLMSLWIHNIRLSDWIILGGITMFFGAFGDLVESLFKRSLCIKDSGSLLPGHGGMLDRFDAVLLSAPVVYIYIKYFAVIVV